jgi:DNA (cytosine-5)-methyltransferase 1
VSCVYYNEYEPRIADWLRRLMAWNLIPAGDVDERSIEDVRPSDLDGYTQCHFFAGIGGWAYALRLASWPDDRPIWTGSCPCQPFSNAGEGRGIDDERHLWPAFRWLIAQCRPSEVAGEQVASDAGREWFAGVRADLEAMGYRVGGADLCAAGVGAPHNRQRLFWVADAEAAKRRRAGRAEDAGRRNAEVRGSGGVGLLSDNDRERRDGKQVCLLAGEPRQACAEVAGSGRLGFWDRYDIIPFGDGKRRRVEPGTFPLAYGVPKRVVKLFGYGNAINPVVGAVFMKAYMEAAGLLLKEAV